MKGNWFYIKLLVLLVLAVFLFAFANKRNASREIAEVTVKFDNESTPFITRETVNKLLKQKDTTLTGLRKEKLDLHEMENSVDAHPIIRDADVYVSASGKMGVFVKQRKPVARIAGKKPYYLDDTGEAMPLSDNYSARVPLFTGIREQDRAAVFRLVHFLNNDAFLVQHITGARRTSSGDFLLHVRNQTYDINIGEVEGLQAKFNNYAAFYKKAQKDQVLNTYRLVNLKFKGQVVSQKK